LGEFFELLKFTDFVEEGRFTVDGSGADPAVFLLKDAEPVLWDRSL